MRTALLLLSLFASCFFRPALAAEQLHFTKLISDRTVPVGTNVTFEIAAEPTNSLSIRWQHDGVLISGATERGLTLTNVQPEDMGRYTVTVANGSSVLSRSAILDLDEPYPGARVISATLADVPLTYGAGRMQVYPVASFSDDRVITVSQEMGGCGFMPCYSSRVWQYFPSTSAVPTWTSSYFDLGNFCRSPRPFLVTTNNNFISGYYYLMGWTPTYWIGPYFYVTSVDSNGKTNWTYSFVPQKDPWGIYSRAFTVGSEQTLDFEMPNRAVVLDLQGGIRLQKDLPVGFRSRGRFFSAPPRATTNFISEISYAPHVTNSWVVGAFALTGAIDWVTEVDFDFDLFGGTGASGDVFVSTRDGFRKILKSGEPAWSVEVSAPVPWRELNWEITRMGHLRLFDYVGTNSIRIADKTSVCLSSSETFVFADIDPGGGVRALQRIKCVGFENSLPTYEPSGYSRIDPSLSFESSGRYRTAFRLMTNGTFGDLTLNVPTNRTFVFRLDIPEPDIATPPTPELTRTLNAGESITLNVSPDLPGAVLYQWFRNGQKIPGATSRNVTVTNFEFKDAGRYSVKLRNAYGAVTNAIATLKYNGPPDIAVDQGNDGRVLLSWPIAQSPLTIETTTDLRQPFTFIAETPVTNTAAGRVELPVTPSKQRAFFRVRSN